MISLNADDSIAQPTAVREWYEEGKTRKQAIDLTLRETVAGQKKRATLKWDYLTPTEYQQLLTHLLGGGALDYYNDQSAVPGDVLEFTALHDFTEGQYVRGASLMKPLEITFYEV